MKRVLFSSIAMLMALALSADAQAGALSLLSLDNSPDFLEDDDYESFIDTDGSGTVNAGDFVVGMFAIQAINTVDTAGFGSTLEGILVAKVASATGTATTVGGVAFAGDALTFTSVSAGEYTTLSTSTGGGGFGWTNLPTRMSASSSVIIYDDMAGAPFVNPDGVGTGVTGANDALLTAVNAAPQILEFGFTGGAYASGTVTPASLTLPTGQFNFVLGLNETFNSTGLSWLKIDIDGGGPIPGVDLFGTGAIDFINPKGDFDIKTDADFVVNPTPEPGSVTLFGLGALGLLGARIRRKRAA